MFLFVIKKKHFRCRNIYKIEICTVLWYWKILALLSYKPHDWAGLHGMAGTDETKVKTKQDSVRRCSMW